MRKDKDKAFSLRKDGRSYREIQAELGISRSTLSDWFRDVSWSRHMKINNTNRTWSPEHQKMMLVARDKKLSDLYIATEIEAEKEYKTYKNEALFWAGLMIYAGEGDKRSKNLVRVTNTEFYLHKIFIMFALKYLGVPRGNLRCCLIIYPDLNESLCKAMWSNLLEIPKENFHKTQVIQGKETRRKLQYGVAMSIISSTVLKKKILKWLALSQDEQFYDAGMV